MYYEIEQTHVNLAFGTTLKELFVATRRYAARFETSTVAVWGYSGEVPLCPYLCISRVDNLSERIMYMERIDRCLAHRGFEPSDRFGMNSYTVYAREATQENLVEVMATFVDISNEISKLAAEKDLLVVYAIHMGEVSVSRDAHLHVFFGSGSVPAVQGIIDDVIYNHSRRLLVKGDQYGQDLWFDP